MNRVIFLLLLISFNSFSMDSKLQKKEQFVVKLLTHQVKQHVSVQNSVSSILKRSPESIDTVLKVALSLYPSKYKEIMTGAIKAEPALTSVVVKTILAAKITSCEEIVKIAIGIEPAYATEIIALAHASEPNNLESIVRVAVSTEPFVSESILKDTKKNNPSAIWDVLAGVIKGLPNHATIFVKKTLALFSSDDDKAKVVSEAVRLSHVEHKQNIIDSAINSGLNERLAMEAATKGSEEKLSLVEDN